MSVEPAEVQIASLSRSVREIEIIVKVLSATAATKEDLQRAATENQVAITKMQATATEMQKTAAEIQKELSAQTVRIVGWMFLLAAMSVGALKYLP